MGGRPVWLASASLRDKRGEIVLTDDQTRAQRAKVAEALEAVLRGIGDVEHERMFRMCTTTCRHRALTLAEADQLPPEWWADPAIDIAGGPVEVLWSKGVENTLSTQPCDRPTRIPLGAGYFPQDCGTCPSCLARKDAVGRPMQRPWN